MSEVRFDEKVVVITGAGRGLGFSYAELIGARGAKLVVNDVMGAEEAVAKLRENGVEAVADSSDISTEEGAKALIQVAMDNYGRVDAVINNAGVYRGCCPFDQNPENYWNDCMKVNVNGTYYVCRAVWPIFKAQGGGKILNTSSTAGLLGHYDCVSYSTSKGAVYGMIRALAIEGAALNIQVNGIAPGAFTAMSAAVEMPEEYKAKLAEEMPTELVAPAAAYLIHESCDCTGRVFEVLCGRVGELFMGNTIGLYDRELTIEKVRDNWDIVTDRTGYRVLPRGDQNTEVIMLAAEAAAKRA